MSYSKKKIRPKNTVDSDQLSSLVINPFSPRNKILSKIISFASKKFPLESLSFWLEKTKFEQILFQQNPENFEKIAIIICDLLASEIIKIFQNRKQKIAIITNFIFSLKSKLQNKIFNINLLNNLSMLLLTANQIIYAIDLLSQSVCEYENYIKPINISLLPRLSIDHHVKYNMKKHNLGSLNLDISSSNLNFSASISYGNLGLLKFELGDYEQGQQYMLKAIELCEKVLISKIRQQKRNFLLQNYQFIKEINIYIIHNIHYAKMLEKDKVSQQKKQKIQQRIVKLINKYISQNNLSPLAKTFFRSKIYNDSKKHFIPIIEITQQFKIFYKIFDHSKNLFNYNDLVKRRHIDTPNYSVIQDKEDNTNKQQIKELQQRVLNIQKRQNKYRQIYNKEIKELNKIKSKVNKLKKVTNIQYIQLKQQKLNHQKCKDEQIIFPEKIEFILCKTQQNYFYSIVVGSLFMVIIVNYLQNIYSTKQNQFNQLKHNALYHKKIQYSRLINLIKRPEYTRFLLPQDQITPMTGIQFISHLLKIIYLNEGKIMFKPDFCAGTESKIVNLKHRLFRLQIMHPIIMQVEKELFDYFLKQQKIRLVESSFQKAEYQLIYNSIKIDQKINNIEQIFLNQPISIQQFQVDDNDQVRYLFVDQKEGNIYYALSQTHLKITLLRGCKKHSRIKMQLFPLHKCHKFCKHPITRFRQTIDIQMQIQKYYKVFYTCLTQKQKKFLKYSLVKAIRTYNYICQECNDLKQLNQYRTFFFDIKREVIYYQRIVQNQKIITIQVIAQSTINAIILNWYQIQNLTYDDGVVLITKFHNGFEEKRKQKGRYQNVNRHHFICKLIKKIGIREIIKKIGQKQKSKTIYRFQHLFN